MSLHKNKHIQIRISEEEKETIQKHCIEKDIDISDYIRSLIRKDFKIVPIEPYIEGYWEDYETDKELEQIGKKYGIENLRMVYWCYSK